MIVAVVKNELDGFSRASHSNDLEKRLSRATPWANASHRSCYEIRTIPVEQVRRRPPAQIIDCLACIRRGRLRRNGLIQDIGQVGHVGRIAPTSSGGRPLEVTVLELRTGLNRDLTYPDISGSEAQFDGMSDIPGAQVGMIANDENAVSTTDIVREGEVDNFLAWTRGVNAGDKKNQDAKEPQTHRGHDHSPFRGVDRWESPFSDRLADVLAERTEKAVIFELFQNVGTPAGGSRDGKDRGEQVGRDPE